VGYAAISDCLTTMPIPDPQTLLLPVLKVLADGAEHTVEEIRERMKNQFNVTPSELTQKNKKGFVFVNRVAWALAHLNMESGPLGHSKEITLIKKGVYRITERGTAILKSNPSELSIKDL
jgi:restriction system protein